MVDSGPGGGRRRGHAGGDTVGSLRQCDHCRSSGLGGDEGSRSAGWDRGGGLLGGGSRLLRGYGGVLRDSGIGLAGDGAVSVGLAEIAGSRVFLSSVSKWICMAAKQ